MAALATFAWLVYFALAFGYRTYVQLRRTGTSGFVGFAPKGSPLERLAGLLFALAIALGFAGAACGVFAPDGEITRALVAHEQVRCVLGLALFSLGLGVTLSSQLAMGSSWRIGVNPSERTALVTRGPFRFVRNPIFSAMLLTGAGLVALYPSALACLAYAALWLGLELQVRRVEEPYLAAVHGPAYRAYAAHTGRFVPGLGRLRAPFAR